MRLTTLLFAVLSVAAAQAQQVSIGVKGGVPLLDPTITHDESRRYLVGPTVEVGLPGNFAVEADALYQRLGSSTALFLGVTTATPPSGVKQITSFPLTLRQRGNSWEFPLLAKYYTPSVGHLHPFLSGGFSLRTIGVESRGFRLLTSGDNVARILPFQQDFRTNLAVGAVGAVGLHYKVGRFAVLPEFRYTRYGSDDRFANKNTANFLLGIGF